MGGFHPQGGMPNPIPTPTPPPPPPHPSPPASSPVLFPTYPFDSPKALALRQEVETMISKGALERVPDPGPGFYSRLFLVEKVSGGWRPVTDPRPSSILGCVPSGLGSSPPRPVSVGDMVTPGELITHQSPGDEGPVPSPPFVQGPSHRPPGDSEVRQFDGSHQQAGGHSLQLPLLVDRSTSPMDGIQQGPTGGEVSAGTIQRPGGPAQPLQPSPGCRMVASPSGSEGPTAHVGFPHSRPVRNTSQCQAASVLLPDPRSPGRLRGCLPSPLGQSRHVRVPSLPSGQESSGSGQRDPKSLDDSGRSSLAKEGVVRGTTPPPDRTTSGTTLLDRLLRQPHFHRFHGGVHALNLHAWRLSSVSSESRAFREELCSRCPAVSESPLHAYTSRNGSFSVVGVVEGALLQSTPPYL